MYLTSAIIEFNEESLLLTARYENESSECNLQIQKLIGNSMYVNRRIVRIEINISMDIV